MTSHATLRDDPTLWEELIQGYEVVRSLSELRDSLGKHIRYSMRSHPNGFHEHRLGGFLVRVDPHGRFMTLKNPAATLEGSSYGKQTWHVQLERTKEGVSIVNTWDVTKDTPFLELTIYKKQSERSRYLDLLQKLDTKEIQITKRPPN